MRRNVYLALCVAGLWACADEDAEPGCGPHYVDEHGGMQFNENPECGRGGVRVPAGAVERRYEFDVDCSDVEGTMPEAYTPASPMFVFYPTELPLTRSAEFEIQHNSDSEVAIGWRADDATDWSILNVPTERVDYEDETTWVRFQFDRFGYFVVLSPSVPADQ